MRRLTGPISRTTVFRPKDTARGMDYHTLQNERHMFRHMDKSDVFSKFDEPGAYFWKPIFYFGQNDSESENAGLLFPAWLSQRPNNELEGQMQSLFANRGVSSRTCAYNYLVRNDEVRRAALLKRFIELLSDISSKSPWYFKEVSGIDAAISRSAFYEDPKVEAKRNQITIKCLPDSVDTRIGELLDLYRAICFSWKTQREIIPANLRKFNMGIYIFAQPYHTDEFNKSLKTATHTYLEFLNCEIDIDSCKIGDTFNNEAAQYIEYSIVISYDRCYADRYSNNIIGYIGDSIITDILEQDDVTTNTDGTDLKAFDSDMTEHNYGDKVIPNLGYSDGQSFLDKVVKNTISGTVAKVEGAVISTVNTFLLGNLYHGSLSTAAMNIMNGHLIQGGAELATTLGQKRTYTRAVDNITGSAVDGYLQAEGSVLRGDRLGKLNAARNQINNL